MSTIISCPQGKKQQEYIWNQVRLLLNEFAQVTFSCANEELMKIFVGLASIH